MFHTANSALERWLGRTISLAERFKGPRGGEVEIYELPKNRQLIVYKSSYLPDWALKHIKLGYGIRSGGRHVWLATPAGEEDIND